MFAIISSFILSATMAWAQLPKQPTERSHPSSGDYSYGFKQETIQINGRKISVFLPVPAEPASEKFPVVVFGHGQAIDVLGYELTFKHLAQKGIAVIHPTFDSGFFDQDWHRMADDFNKLTEATINKYSNVIDSKKIVYSGHSKGGYVALMAAGAPNLTQLSIKPSAILLFAPADYDRDYLKTVDPAIPVTVVWSDNDTVIKQRVITDIYADLKSAHKQWILVNSYAELKADHFFPLSKSYFFGGQNGVSAYHYFATWKWLTAAAFDLQSESPLSNSYIYGENTGSTGVAGLEHTIIKNW
jgi:dienelactone hydrolase